MSEIQHRKMSEIQHRIWRERLLDYMKNSKENENMYEYWKRIKNE